MIAVTALRKRIGNRAVLDGVSFTVAVGEIVALVGPSGTGKSVLLKHIIGLMLPDSGDVLIGGRSIVHARARELTAMRQRIGYVFQDAALLDSLTIAENLRLALHDVEGNDVVGTRKILDALAAVNLGPDELQKFPGELSGGMRKRAGVARALINCPGIVLYDEPTTGLDPQNIEIINEAITASRANGATSIVITHDMESVAAIADRVLMLADGQIQFHGTPDQFFEGRDARVASFTTRTGSPRRAS